VKDKDLEVLLKGKSLTLSTPKGRKLKARLLEPKAVLTAWERQAFGTCSLV
jgi:hypothetical protein